VNRYFCLAALTLAGALADAGPAQHAITATLNYDFTSDSACSATLTTGCVKQFNVYDLSGATPVKLFSIPAPPGANGPVTGITGSSGLITLRSGAHTFGATAQMADGTESDPNACTATALVKPGAPVSFTVFVQ
jgi:environmental stress-induced protein Ves